MLAVFIGDAGRGIAHCTYNMAVEAPSFILGPLVSVKSRVESYTTSRHVMSMHVKCVLRVCDFCGELLI